MQRHQRFSRTQFEATMKFPPCTGGPGQHLISLYLVILPENPRNVHISCIYDLFAYT